MNQKTYENLEAYFDLGFGILLGIAFSIFVILMATPTSAENITINNTYYINQTINNTYYLNTTYYLNVTFYNYTAVNLTNITYCNNCTYLYNFTNITYTNVSYNNITANYTTIYYGDNFTANDYYTKTDTDSKVNLINEKFNNYILKSDFPNLINSTNSTANSWRAGTDTYLALGIVLSLIVGAVAIVIGIRGGFG